MYSSGRGHAILLCIAPVLVYVMPQRALLLFNFIFSFYLLTLFTHFSHPQPHLGATTNLFSVSVSLPFFLLFWFLIPHTREIICYWFFSDLFHTMPSRYLHVVSYGKLSLFFFNGWIMFLCVNTISSLSVQPLMDTYIASCMDVRVGL